VPILILARRASHWTALLAAPVAALLLPSPPVNLFAPWPWPPAAATLRINLSPSLPRGLYLLKPLSRPARAGDLVLACPPLPAAVLARRRGYLDPGPCPGGTRFLGKFVLAAAGDRVGLTAGGLAVNACHLPSTASQPADTRGRPLPRLTAGAYCVHAGEVWLFSPHPRSFDSRYFGPIAVTQIGGILSPLVVLRPALLRAWADRLRDCAAAHAFDSPTADPPAPACPAARPSAAHRH
jgi:conjugative transfer signal peptidase TraF